MQLIQTLSSPSSVEVLVPRQFVPSVPALELPLPPGPLLARCPMLTPALAVALQPVPALALAPASVSPEQGAAQGPEQEPEQEPELGVEQGAELARVRVP
eukprot:SAG31_NODE_3_length_45830_cov_42.279701_24_plen_100_part_00